MASVCVVLMCGGQQTRMGVDQPPKQLTPVLGVPNIVRTVALIRDIAERALIHIVAPKTPAWAEIARETRASLVGLESRLFLESAFTAMPRMPATIVDRYLVLCGDTIFSPQVLRDLIRPRPRFAEGGHAPILFAGRFAPHLYTGRDSGELYGFSFEARAYGTMITAAREAIAKADSYAAELRTMSETVDRDAIETIRERNCRLWHFLHMLEDAGLAQLQEVAIDDYTDDIDAPEDLVTLPAIEHAITVQEAYKCAKLT